MNSGINIPKMNCVIHIQMMNFVIHIPKMNCVIHITMMNWSLDIPMTNCTYSSMVARANCLMGRNVFCV